MTRSQRLLLVAVTLTAAISRWFALAKTPWDWDEMLFMLAMPFTLLGTGALMVARAVKQGTMPEM